MQTPKNRRTPRFKLMSKLRQRKQKSQTITGRGMEDKERKKDRNISRSKSSSLIRWPIDLIGMRMLSANNVIIKMWLILGPDFELTRSNVISFLRKEGFFRN